MSTLKCKFCNNEIPFQIKIAAEDFMDEHTNELENMQGGVKYDQSFDPKKDTGDLYLLYLDTLKKNYPGKKNMPDYQEDDMGMSTVAKVKDKFIVQCDKCKSIYLEDINSSNLKISGINPPESNDTYHQDNYRDFGDTSPIAYLNETHEDNKKVMSTPDTEETNKKKVRRLKPYVKD